MKREKGKWEEPKATCGRNKKKGVGGRGQSVFLGQKCGQIRKKKNIQALYNPENFENYGQQ
jgi:hypothetical protein